MASTSRPARLKISIARQREPRSIYVEIKSGEAGSPEQLLGVAWGSRVGSRAMRVTHRRVTRERTAFYTSSSFLRVTARIRRVRADLQWSRQSRNVRSFPPVGGEKAR
eukprot:4994784-Prymnesium_polylepis.1